MEQILQKAKELGMMIADSEQFARVKDAEEAQEAFEKICENKNIKAYLEANRAFSSMIEQVNTIIGYFVKGGDASGCGGNCSSCSGCH